MSKSTKSDATKARDKRLRRTNAEAREAGLRTPVSVRLTPGERASLESYAAMRGMTLSEAIRSRACHYSPDGEKAAEYARNLYYGMRENGAELMESNRQVRVAYEENARKAFGLSVAVNRFGVNVNQIARRVNAGAVGDDAERWLSELQYCVQILNEILATGGVENIRAIPPLESGSSKGVPEASSKLEKATGKDVGKPSEKAPSKATEKASAEAAETDAKTDTEIEPNARAEKASETKQETTAKSSAKPKPKTDAKSKPQKTAKPKPEPVVQPRPESTVKVADDDQLVGSLVAKPGTDGSERARPERERIVPIADESRGETQDDVDREWVEGLLKKPNKGKRKRVDGDGISDEWRERVELMVSEDMPKGGR